MEEIDAILGLVQTAVTQPLTVILSTLCTILLLIVSWFFKKKKKELLLQKNIEEAQRNIGQASIIATKDMQKSDEKMTATLEADKKRLEKI